MIYLDNAATTPLIPEALDAMLPFLTENYANPSGIYRSADQARKAVREAGRKLAALLSCSPTEIFFTGSGTESDNTALRGVAESMKGKGRRIITSKIEHPAVLNTCKYLEGQGFELIYLEVSKDGLVAVDSLKKALTEDTILVSVMAANNEVGSLQPIKELAKVAHEAGALFHTDAVQALGNIELNVRELGVDLMSLSAHKIGGPKGVGALYKSEKVNITPLLLGGGQERGLRSGTENVAGIVGFGVAAEFAAEGLKRGRNKTESELRDYLLNRLLNEIEDIHVNGSMTERLPGNINISVPGAEAQTMLVMLSAEDLCASGGSACSSQSGKPSHVLTAMGLPEDYIRGALRLTLGWQNTKEEMDQAFEKIKSVIEKARKLHI